MSEQNCNPDNPSIMGSLPADKPQAFMFYSKGLYYYISSCCVPPEHWGVFISPRYLLPGELGCPDTGEIPRLPPGPTTENTPHTHRLSETAEPLRRVQLCGLYSTGNIGNCNKPIVQFILGTVGILNINESLNGSLKKPLQVCFQTDNRELQPFLENRIFSHSIFEISFSVARKGHFETIHFLLHLAECVSRSGGTDKSSPIKVSGQYSPAWSDPLGGGDSISAGRLLKLNVEEGVYRGSTIFVTNDVS